MQSGIGTHSSLLGKYTTNVNIQYNVFEHITNTAIRCMDYRDVLIRYNVIDDAAIGVSLYYGRPTAMFMTTKNGTEKNYGSKVQHNVADAQKNNQISNNYFFNIKKHANASKNYPGKADTDPHAILIKGQIYNKTKDSASNNTSSANNYIENIVVQKNTIQNPAGVAIHIGNVRNSKVINNNFF